MAIVYFFGVAVDLVMITAAKMRFAGAACTAPRGSVCGGITLLVQLTPCIRGAFSGVDLAHTKIFSGLDFSLLHR